MKLLVNSLSKSSIWRQSASSGGKAQLLELEHKGLRNKAP
ncbi:hypothetical protein KX02_1871 (plasmid) [Francisella tularensis subsp. novicida]|nr:hypothetical protein KX02_1871 [Francisella tularensis subsp. novicida]